LIYDLSRTVEKVKTTDKSSWSHKETDGSQRVHISAKWMGLGREMGLGWTWIGEGDGLHEGDG